MVIWLSRKKSSSRVGVVGYYSEEYRIEIEVPIGVSLKVRGDDGDYYIKNISGSVLLDLDDADAELAGCTGDNLNSDWMTAISVWIRVGKLRFTETMQMFEYIRQTFLLSVPT
jgi:hypothetical protein